MKLITANFLTCAVKGCKASPASFPLHFKDAELVLQELDFQPEFIRNIIPRIDWDGLQKMANEVSAVHTPQKGLRSLVTKLGFPKVLEKKPEGNELNDEQILRELHQLLLETQIIEGRLICGNCGHEYLIKEGIANFLLPSHLGLTVRFLTISPSSFANALLV
jgi:multifunctional methyltransferase subunit TRM112